MVGGAQGEVNEGSRAEDRERSMATRLQIRDWVKQTKLVLLWHAAEKKVEKVKIRREQVWKSEF